MNRSIHLPKMLHNSIKSEEMNKHSGQSEDPKPQPNQGPNLWISRLILNESNEKQSKNLSKRVMFQHL